MVGEAQLFHGYGDNYALLHEYRASKSSPQCLSNLAQAFRPIPRALSSLFLWFSEELVMSKRQPRCPFCSCAVGNRFVHVCLAARDDPAPDVRPGIGQVWYRTPVGFDFPATLVAPSSKSSVDPEELNRRLEKVLLDQKLDDLELEVEYLYWTDERLGLV